MPPAPSHTATASSPTLRSAPTRWSTSPPAGGPGENRERELQCPEEQRIPSRTQLRARESQSFRRVRVPEPARFRLPYRLRSGRRSLAQGDGENGLPQPVLRKSAIHHHLPDLPHLGRSFGNAGLRQTSAHCPLNN